MANNGPDCSGCKFAKHVNFDVYECHRYPPSVTMAENGLVYRWPDVNGWSWCGEHQATASPRTAETEE